MFYFSHKFGGFPDYESGPKTYFFWVVTWYCGRNRFGGKNLNFFYHIGPKVVWHFITR